MTNKFLKRKYVVLIIILALAAILVPEGRALAIDNPLKGLFGIGDIISSAVTKMVTYFIQTLVGIFAKMMGFFADLLDEFVKFQNYNLPIIPIMWNIMKNFVNMFFILILIIISFATIFDVAKYSYKAVLPTLIIVALLMNFSLVIGQTTISASDLLTHAFLAQIKGGPDGLSKNLMNGFNLQKPLGVSGKEITESEGTDTNFNVAFTIASQYERLLINLIFLLVLMVIALLAFIVAALFVFIRTPVLMFLLILSPAAAFLYILPSTRQYFTKWWNAFISWVFFLPVYVFFLMFAIIFINTRAQAPDLGTSGSLAGDFFNFNDIFFYIVTLLFMIVGLSTARKVGTFAAGGVTAAVSKIHGGVKKYAGRISGVTPVYEGAKEGLAAKGKQIQEKGLFGIPGDQAARLRKARVAEVFGLGALPGGARKAELEEAKKEAERLKAQIATMTTQEGERHLRDKMRSGSDMEKTAAMQVLDSKKRLSANEQIELYQRYGGDRSEAARQYAKDKMDYKNPDWTPEMRQRFFEQTNDAEIKEKVLDARAEIGDLHNASVEMLENLAKIFRTQKKAVEFLDKTGRKNEEGAFRAKFNLGLIRDESGNVATDLQKARMIFRGDVAKARAAEAKAELQKWLRDAVKKVGEEKGGEEERREDKKKEDKGTTK